jgi:hypothetical protein
MHAFCMAAVACITFCVGQFVIQEILAVDGLFKQIGRR